MKILCDDDSKPPGGGGDNKPAAPPTTPGDVKRTPIKHPQIIALEKKVSGLEDKTDALSDALDGVNNFLEGLNLGGPPAPGDKKKIPVEFKDHQFKKKADDTPAPTGGFLSDVEKEIWGGV